MTDLQQLYEAVLDSIDQEIVVIHHDGTIVYVNRAWKQFGADNNFPCQSMTCENYLRVCILSAAGGDAIASDVVNGIQAVASGQNASFYYEYPCHSPDKKRWFMMRVTPLSCGLERLLVISHQDITERKLIEERVQFQALHDPLTGLANRLHFTEIFDNEWRRCLRNRQPLSLVMLDIDFFKQYNDTFGHPAGDRCLIEVANVLKKFSNRAEDLAARYGGEEFVLILGNMTCGAACRLAELIREAVYQLAIGIDACQRVTLSAGVASTVPSREKNHMSLLSEADAALYRAKREGRNRVVAVDDQ